MGAIFSKLFNMSYTAGIVIAAIILARLLLKKAPRRFSYALWAIALIRLLCPFNLESVLSLMPQNTEPIPADIVYQAAPRIETGVPFVNNAVSSVLPAAEPYGSVNPMQTVLLAAAAVWLLGVLALFAYAVISYLRLRRRLAASVSLPGDVRLTDCVSPPFVLGVIRPKIYLPSALTERERELVLMHEQTHIRRGDHIIRIISFAALCLHWFNPLVWAAYVLSGRDMEVSCDEAVIRKSPGDIRAEYSALLLGLATGRRVFAAAPLAFGEGDTGHRIKNVLSFKKPAVWAAVAAVALIAVLYVTLLTNPAISVLSSPFGAIYAVSEVTYTSPLMSTLYLDGGTPEFLLTSDYGLFRKNAGSGDLSYAGGFAETDMSRDDFSSLFMETFYDAGQTFDGNSKMWRLDTGDSFYLLLQQKEGSVLIAECFTSNAASGEYSYVRYLYALERLADEPELTPYDSEGNIAGIHNAGDGYTDVPRQTPGVSDRDGGDWVEREISAAILGQNEGHYGSGGFSAEAHTILGIEEETKGYLTIYIMALYQEFSFSGGKLTVTGGSHMPVAIVFETTGENYYNLAEYWMPGDGADYASSIRGRFPADIEEKAIDTQLYVTGHMISCYAQAVQYGRVDTAGVIAGLIGEICSSPAEASSPYAYISARDVEYRELVWYGQYTLDYCCALFETGGQMGLEGHIMAAACRDILAVTGIAAPSGDGYETGQDWYDAFIAA